MGVKDRLIARLEARRKDSYGLALAARHAIDNLAEGQIRS